MEFESYRKDVDSEIKRRKAKTLATIGGYVTGQAKLLASGFKEPTGRLMGSIEHDETENSTQVGTNVEYGIYVEKGTGIYAEGGGGRQTPWAYEDDKGEWHFTRGQRPQPYLTPAAERNIDKIQKIAQEGMSDD